MAPSKLLAGVILAGLLTSSLQVAQAQKGAEALIRHDGTAESAKLSRIADRASALMPESRRAEWLAAGKSANLQAKQDIAEELGMAATRKVAESRGHQPLLEVGEIPHHGPDLPTTDSEGRIHLYESKGGSSQIRKSYGYPQGTPENGVEYYKRVLDSPTATPRQKEVAALVLKRAAEGRVDAHVVQLELVQGEPKRMTIIDRDCTPKAQKLAQAVLRDEKLAAVAATQALPAESAVPVTLCRSTALGEAAGSAPLLRNGARAAEEAAQAARATGGVAKGAAKLAEHAGPIGIAVEVGVRGYSMYKTETDFQEGRISAYQRGEKHAENIGGAIGGGGGAAAGAAAGAAIGAPFGGIGAVPGAVIGGIIGAIGGGFVGDAAGSAAGGAIYRATQ